MELVLVRIQPSRLKFNIMARCACCGKTVENSGSGRNMGTQNKPMCERCYEKGGDDE